MGEYRLTSREMGRLEQMLQFQREAEQRLESLKQEVRAALAMLIESHDLPNADWRYENGVLRQVGSATAAGVLPQPTRTAASRTVLDALAARETNDAERAIELASQAIVAGDPPTDPYTIKAACQGDLGDHIGAMATLEEGIVACGSTVDTSPLINERGFQRILSGERDMWLPGWVDWDERPQRKEKAKNLAAVWPEIKEWDGSQGKVVLVDCDKGLGDTVLFSRYLWVLLSAGCKLQINCSKASEPFMPVLSGKPNVLGAYGGSDTIPKLSEMWISLESLPKYVHSPVVPRPFDLGPRWSPDPFKEKLLVGVCWHGAVGYAAAKHRRPEKFELWERLSAVPGIDFVSLQLGEAGFCGAPLPKSSSIADTAKVASKCDVVISVDTSVSHIAASCGVPTWVPMHRLNYWPWVKSGVDGTVWYESMKFFRQTSPNDWESVFDRIAEELKKLRGLGTKLQVVAPTKSGITRKAKK